MKRFQLQYNNLEPTPEWVSYRWSDDKQKMLDEYEQLVKIRNDGHSVTLPSRVIDSETNEVLVADSLIE